jgi:gluconolactonase
MAVDVDGNVYVALVSMRGDAGVAVYDPTGKRVAFIPTPTPARNVTFGRGSEARTMYITAGNGLYRIPVKRRGYLIPTRRPN